MTGKKQSLGEKKQSLVWPFISAIVVSVFVNFAIQPLANHFWRSPFSPKITAGPYIYSVHPQKSGSLNVVFWLTFANEGEVAGSIDSLGLQISLPQKEWFLRPIFTVDGEEYLRMFMQMKYDETVYKEPFKPVYLPAHSQVSRAILFKEFEDSLDLQLLEDGNHKIRLYARGAEGQLKNVWTGIFTVDKDQLKSGKSIRFLQKPKEKLLREELQKQSGV